MIKFVRIASFLIAVVVTIFSIFLVNGEQELAEAQAAYRSGDMDQALRKARRANKALSENNKKVSAYYVQARAASKMHWTEKSREYLDKLLSIDPKNTSGLLFRGEILLQLGEYNNALRDFNDGITGAENNLKPVDLAYALTQRGLVFIELNEIEAAQKDANKALQLTENLPETHDLLSKVYEAKGQFKKALEECEMAYQLSIKKNNLSFMTPEGKELSERLVDLRVKVLRMN